MLKGFFQFPMAFSGSTIKKAVFWLPVLLFFSTPGAQASWLLDPAGFHASAHGQTTCTDCHGNVADQALHPKPGNVGKHANAFFQADQCLDCHDDIMENLNRDMHGARKINAADEYANCLRCHDPHTQPRLGENRIEKYDPGRAPEEQCGVCHKQASVLPPISGENAACMTCHQARNQKNPEEIKAIRSLCLHCHGDQGLAAQTQTAKRIPLMDNNTYGGTPHAHMACTECHTDAAAFGHDRQPAVNCLKCHLPHDEKVAHDAHMGISCQACHLQGIALFRNGDAPVLRWKRKGGLTDLSILHRMNIPDRAASCKRCHFAGNDLGAASMALPAKSILCMPCHTATFSLNDTVSIIAAVIFLFGVALFTAVLLTGAMTGITSTNPFVKLFHGLWFMLRTIFSPGIFKIARALFWDGFLQRRLYERSPGRWFIHGLIFYPFVFRFFWGLAALSGSLWIPGNTIIWDMINKNHPLTAVLFDLTGTMILSGVILAWVRGGIQKRNRAAGTPDQDRIALALMGGIVIVGFLLEGIRIVMTGQPANAGFSFVGYMISLWFEPSRGLPEVFSFIWYIHVVLTGAFIAYIPFSRLLHMILAPVVIAMNSVSPAHGAHDDKPEEKSRDQDRR